MFLSREGRLFLAREVHDGSSLKRRTKGARRGGGRREEWVSDCSNAAAFARDREVLPWMTS